MTRLEIFFDEFERAFEERGDYFFDRGEQVAMLQRFLDTRDAAMVGEPPYDHRDTEHLERVKHFDQEEVAGYEVLPHLL